MYTNIKTVALGLAFASLTKAQTHSLCNPVEGDKCPPNPAFSTDDSLDLTKLGSIADLEKFFAVDGGIKYDTKYDQLTFDGEGGMEMSIHEERHAPLLISHNYLFFGHAEVELRAAPGAGIITSIVLQSDCLDEIDWEFVGNDQTSVQTNLFHKGVEDYSHGQTHDLGFNAMDEYHTYAIDWTPEKIVFSINGNVVREHLPSSGVFPQTPSQLRIGTWVGGKGDSQGTIDWAGGRAQWDQAPFNAYYRRIQIIDYAGGYEGAKQYEYSNTNGTWESIKVVGGKQVGFPNSDFPPVNNHEMSSETSSSAASSTVSSSSVESSISSSVSESSSVASSTEASSSVEESSSATSSDVASETSGTTAPTGTPTSDGSEEEEEETPGSGAASLQTSGLLVGLALSAFALLM